MKTGRPRRYRRKVAGPKQWQAIRAEKPGPCRVCHGKFGYVRTKLEMHHLVSRAHGGDDVADNLVPLCPTCHDLVSRYETEARAILAESLTDTEYAYIVGKLGEGAMQRLFGVDR